ncbi:golgi uridine diphosphate-N- acetylglucosamine transporter [Coemansia sp. RSA 2399]|nr:golgi uridine diphosphate-N- acetylglucosamine transporter [Coemansia sp. RSA 2399]KAJ1908255.1 golgi uridine diphosphate-N- acetylglucosamine transporter [Coemansia sp. IMI 209127]
MQNTVADKPRRSPDRADGRSQPKAAEKAAAIVSSVLALDWVLVFASIFGGCCSNVYALESLVREEPKCGNLITFGQFLFITLVGLPSHIHQPHGSWLPRLRPRKVPLSRWVVMVGLYFGVSALNNMAFGFKVSIPLHIVFRSSGLIANMACGFLVMKKRYPAKQVVAVVMVSVGVIVATIASVGSRDHSGGADDSTKRTTTARGFRIDDSVIGIAFLSCSVVLAAFLGLYQESTYIKYGKHWQEGLFYNHLLALPMFVLFRNDIYRQLVAISQSPPLSIFSAVPHLWLALVINVLSQWLCASGVHKLTTMSTSLTLNVVLNFRKLVSLVLSVVIFSNPVTPSMLCGCALVFIGTFAYSQSAQKPAALRIAEAEDAPVNPPLQTVVKASSSSKAIKQHTLSKRHASN